MGCILYLKNRAVKVLDTNNGEAQSLAYNSLSQLRFILLLLSRWCNIEKVVIETDNQQKISIAKDFFGNLIGGISEQNN
jgi:hypothetical protein